MKKIIPFILLALVIAWDLSENDPVAAVKTPVLQKQVSTAPVTANEKENPANGVIATALPVSPKEHVRSTLDLAGKSLRTNEENELLARLVSNPEIATAMVQRLNFPVQVRSEATIESRLEAVEYLETVLYDRNNPSRSVIVAEVEKFLLSPTEDGTSLEVRRMVGADKAELFRAIASSDPVLAAKLIADARGTTNEKIFRFAQGYFELESKSPKEG